MALTAKQLKKLIPLALKRAREQRGFTIDQAVLQSKIDKLTLENHERGINLPNMHFFLLELQTYGLDFGRFHELLLEVDNEMRQKELEEKIQQLEQRLLALEQSVKPKAS